MVLDLRWRNIECAMQAWHRSAMQCMRHGLSSAKWRWGFALREIHHINKANTYYWRFQIRQYQTLSAVTVGIQCLVSQRENIFICNKLFHTQFDDIQQLVAKLFGNSFSSFSKILDKSNLDYVFVDRITMERCISNHSKFWSRCMSHKTLHCLNDTYLNELCINVVASLSVGQHIQYEYSHSTECNNIHSFDGSSVQRKIARFIHWSTPNE